MPNCNSNDDRLLFRQKLARIIRAVRTRCG